jgi:hypothetical protein
VWRDSFFGFQDGDLIVGDKILPNFPINFSTSINGGI